MKSDVASWRERCIGWRNRLLAAPAMQREAARWPIARTIARRRAKRLFDLVAGFSYSQILAACVESGLLQRLGEGPLSAADVAAAIALREDAAERLLKAAASLDLVERLGDRWALGQQGAALLGNQGIAAMIAHHRAFYADFADPLDLLRRGGGGGALAAYWRYAEHPGAGDDAEVAPYSALMAASQPMIAGQVLDAYRFDRHRRMLDIGGGEAAFACAVAARAPDLTIGIFDIPAVAKRAQMRFDAAGLASRGTAHGGNFLSDALPGGYDLMTLVRVLHDHDDGPALALLRNIRTALPPGGRLLIAEPMAATPGAEAAGDGYFGMYLWAMGSGRPRVPHEIRAMLRDAGFSRSDMLRTTLPLITNAIIAHT